MDGCQGVSGGMRHLGRIGWSMGLGPRRTSRAMSEAVHASSKPEVASSTTTLVPPMELLKLLRVDADTSISTRVESISSLSYFHPFTGRRLRVTNRVSASLKRLGFVADPCDCFRLRLGTLPDTTSKPYRDLRRAKEGSWQLEFVAILERCGLPVGDGDRKKDSPNGAPLPVAQTDGEDNRCALLEKLNREISQLYHRRMDLGLPAKLLTAFDLEDTQQSSQPLTDDQAYALRVATTGACMYIGGAAGTGKTAVLKAIYAALTRKGLRVALTATTGAAAVNIGGCTTHHALGMPVDRKGSFDTYALRSIDVLIIDEISMLTVESFEDLDVAARHARAHNCPFGGIQLILSGDFLQLCAVNGFSSKVSVADPICCSHRTFSLLTKVILTTSLRHKHQDQFVQMLQRLRVDELTDKDVEQLNDMQRTHVPPQLAGSAIHLFPLRKTASEFNDRRIAEIPGELVCIRSLLGATINVGNFSRGVWIVSKAVQGKTDALDEAVQEAAKSTLGISLAVDDILLHPMGCFDGACLPRLHMNSARPFAQLLRIQLSDKVAVKRSDEEAFCARVAKELRCLVVPISDKDTPLQFSEEVQSRFKSDIRAEERRLKIGCRVMITRNLNRTVINGSLGVVEGFAPPNHSLFPRGASSCALSSITVSPKHFPLLPVVRFGATNEVYQIPPVTTTYGGGPATLFFAQEVHALPIQLGYAFTVHKVQGLTIDVPVVIDFTSNFRCPHLAYVALSRVRNPANIYLRGMKPTDVCVHAKCLAFEKHARAAADAAVTAEGAVDGAPAATGLQGLWARRNVAIGPA